MFIPLHDANTLRHIRVQWVTMSIIAINVVVWLMFGSGYAGQDLARATFFSCGFIPAVANGYESLPAVYDLIPGPATYLTYAFLHGDFMHLAGNMLFIWVFGDNVEDAVGHLRYIVFYLACAAAGAFAHQLAQPYSEAPLIGASGAAAGIIAAYLMLHPHVKVWILALGRIPLRLSAIWVIGAWIAFQLFKFIDSPGDRVSWAAHLGGIMAGAALIPFMKRRGVRLFDRTPVDEVIPPVPPPAVAEEGYALPGQPHTADGRALPEAQDSGAPPPSPWGRQRRQ